MFETDGSLGIELRKLVEAAVTEEREACAKIAEEWLSYTGRGTEDNNDLIGMFARGNRNASKGIAAAIRHR